MLAMCLARISSNQHFLEPNKHSPPNLKDETDPAVPLGIMLAAEIRHRAAGDAKLPTAEARNRQAKQRSKAESACGLKLLGRLAAWQE
jgi:hypothetical protein